MSTTTLAITYRQICCHKCSARYALDERFAARRQNDGQGWNCPYCRVGTAYSTSTVQKLQAKLDRTETRLERTQRERDGYKHGERAQKAAKTRIKNRIKNGVCPCCNRTFSNLAKHMANQHPGFSEPEQ